MMRKWLLSSGLLLVLTGCTGSGMSWNAPDWQSPTPPPTDVTVNRVFIPISDPQLVSDMTAEVLDDYFKIQKEDPARLIGNTLTEGRIDTFPEVSPTLLEPWRNDTASIDQRLENTLQTYRRRAVVRILPSENGFTLEVSVFLELEDPPEGPEHATAGASTFRYDSAFSRVENPVGNEVTTQGWIAKGRDPLLEQRILTHLLTRSQELVSR